MATIRKKKEGYYKCTHIEADGCVINLREGLSDRKGRAVTSVEILPDDHYAGEKVWRTFPSASMWVHL